jgi:hypothetical protein
MKTRFLIMWLALVAAVLALLYYTPATGSAKDATVPSAEVLRLDQARLAAMMAGDAAALGRLLSEELIFVHSDGRSESKADYLKNLMAGDTQYADAKTSDVNVRSPAADVVIVTGAQEMRKRLGPTWSDIRLRYMAVWRNEAGTWRMFAWQSMRPAGNSVPPKAENPNARSPTPAKSP